MSPAPQPMLSATTDSSRGQWFSAATAPCMPPASVFALFAAPPPAAAPSVPEEDEEEEALAAALRFDQRASLILVASNGGKWAWESQPTTRNQSVSQSVIQSTHTQSQNQKNSNFKFQNSLVSAQLNPSIVNQSSIIHPINRDHRSGRLPCLHRLCNGRWGGDM